MLLWHDLLDLVHEIEQELQGLINEHMKAAHELQLHLAPDTVEGLDVAGIEVVEGREVPDKAGWCSNRTEISGVCGLEGSSQYEPKKWRPTR